MMRSQLRQPRTAAAWKLLPATRKSLTPSEAGSTMTVALMCCRRASSADHAGAGVRVVGRRAQEIRAQQGQRGCQIAPGSHEPACMHSMSKQCELADTSTKCCSPFMEDVQQQAIASIAQTR